MWAQEKADIQSTVRNFLTLWYVEKDYAQLQKSIAEENVFSKLTTSEQRERASPRDIWAQIFADAFEDSKVRFRSLSEAIGFPEPALPPDAKPLFYSNAGPDGRLLDPFAVVKPESFPPGSIFPLAAEYAKDRQARYLYDLSQSKKGRLYVVMYVTKGRGLVIETAVLYWVQEGGLWKLAAFQGTDW